MKKLLAILVLGLLWCNVGFAERMSAFSDTKNFDYNFICVWPTVEALKGDFSKILFKFGLVRAKSNSGKALLYREWSEEKQYYKIGDRSS